MAHHKLKKFADLATFSNTVQLDPVYKGKWRADFFKNQNPLTLELACGKGDYTLELARRFPAKNFIGIDIKGARLWCGAKTALAEGLTNVAFLRIYIDHILEYFEAGEISEIWLTFPDPFPKNHNIQKRLTHPRFVQMYRKILANGGKLHFKTDDEQLFRYTQKVLKSENAHFHTIVDDLYAAGIDDELLLIQTTFEKSHLANGRTIRYLCVSL